MLQIACTRFCPLPPDLLSVLDSAKTKLDRTGSGRFRNLSSVDRHDIILWGRVPPITVSLFPMVSRTTPTSPIAPHCIASPAK